MKLTVYEYEWNEHEKAFRIYEPDCVHQTCAYLPEDDMAHEILKQSLGDRRYIPADVDSHIRASYAVFMKVFVKYRKVEVEK